MILIRKGNHANIALGAIRINHDLVVPPHETAPLEVRRDTLRHAQHVAVHGARRLALLGHDLVELLEAFLHDLDDVCFELREVVLDLAVTVSIITSNKKTAAHPMCWFALTAIISSRFPFSSTTCLCKRW